MLLPKFIITKDGHFRLGMVNLHENLLKSGDKCIGGGYYYIDHTALRIVLDRSSYDFGPPQWQCLDHLIVPTAYRGMRIVYYYDNASDEKFVVSDELKIIYEDS